MKLVKEIKSKDGVLHFRRWQLLKTPWFVINVHGIYHKDEDQHLHNHPWNFLSIVLWGSYVEQLQGSVFNLRTFLDTAYRKAETYHKIYTLCSKSVYTLNFMSAKTKEWGYNVDGKFVGHQEYRKIKRGEL
ncbi:MAG: hypothetical protein E6Q36_05370 [Chryseobacterium sp.]|nr:MAG: hypothetical protein E6Q36_05370 [Chryseobacterium sp.]